MKSRLWVVASVPALILALLLAAAPAVSAHPLGNYTTNQFVGLHIGPGAISVDYVVDMAEIPAFQELRRLDADRDGRVGVDERSAYEQKACADAAAGLTVGAAGEPLQLRLDRALLTFPPGQGGLDTLRLECRFRSPVTTPGDGYQLDVGNANYADRIGWREIVAAGQDVLLATDLPSTSSSARLTAYPEYSLRSPPDVRTASIGVSASPGVAGPAPEPEAAPPATTPITDRFASLISRESFGPATLGIALLAAFVLGLGHALAPGHGKTVMAAYLVGTRGTKKQALILGLAVALSHTAGVMTLGIITFVASAAFRPERVLPYLSVAAGLIILAIGIWLLIHRLRDHRRARREKHHEAGHHHHRHGFLHRHADPAAWAEQGTVGWRMLATLGLSNGLVPSASAVVLLLGAGHLGRVAVGVLLIAAFAAGMAVALVGIGMGLVMASRMGLRLLPRGRTATALAAVLPLAMAVAVTIIGVAMIAGAAQDLLH